MVQDPSDHFITLVATLLEALPDNGSSIKDDIILQLHAIFGSMLVSALQLVDRREVVKVLLPNGRYIYQITSATGSPYTLFAALPDRPPPALEPRSLPGSSPPPHEDVELEDHPGSSSPTPASTARTTRDSDDRHNEINESREASMHAHVLALRRCMKGMYCPCTGYGFNTLAGDKNIFCKHLLALVLAHCMNRLVHTEVYLKDVVNLLGLASMPVLGQPQSPPRKQEPVH